MALFSFKKPDNKQEQNDGWFSRLKQGLSRTRQNLSSGLGDLFLGKKAIDDELLEDIETSLLTADMGVEVTQAVIAEITGQVSRKELADSGALYQALRQQLLAILQPSTEALSLPEQDKPFSILVVGVNGAGKTTTIGKLAKHLQNAGQKVLLAAGDTFRAAAVEQLQTWGQRNDVTVIAQQSGSDCAAVIFDAMQAASARNIDVIIADTAGRLQTQSHLMEELKKVKRVMAKHDPDAPQEVIEAPDGLLAFQRTSLDGSRRVCVVVNVSGADLNYTLPTSFASSHDLLSDVKTTDGQVTIHAGRCVWMTTDDA